MNIQFNNKKVLVCGASQGIGYAIARRFAIAGATVTISSANEDKLSKAARAISKESGTDVIHIAMDYSNSEAAMNIFRNSFPGPQFDILINNTGGPAPGLLSQDNPDKLIKAFHQHILFCQALTSYLLPFMKDTEFGRIINITSIGAKQPVHNLGTSNVIRGAMTAWAKTLSKELGRFGITVNNILPGHTLTGRLESLIQTNADNTGICYEEMKAKMVADIPAGRLGSPDDMANLALFLASEFASFINGANIPVDGGYLSCL